MSGSGNDIDGLHYQVLAYLYGVLQAHRGGCFDRYRIHLDRPEHVIRLHIKFLQPWDCVTLEGIDGEQGAV